MATLILKWPLTDGSGTELAESINSREMHFATAGSYPAWATGPSGVANTAITPSGSTSSGAYAATDETITCAYDYTTNNINYTGITVAARFKNSGSSGGGILSSFYLDSVNRPSAGSPANIFLGGGSYISMYVTTSKYLRFGWRAANSQSARWPSVSGPLLTDGAWNIAIAKIISPKVGKIYANGSWYSTVLNSLCGEEDANGFPSSGFMEQFWAIGTGYNSFDSYNYQNYCGGQNRSYYGDIGECRVYCGQLTDDEIEDLYDELINPGVKNALMFSCNT
jgi:hypothetical protein